MKRFYLLPVLALLAITIGACSGGNTPSGMAKKMVGYLQEKKYDKFVDCIANNDPRATPEETAKNKQMLIAMLKEKGDKSLAEKGGLKKYEVTGETISPDGNTAVVRMKYTYGNGTNDDETLNMVKEDGRWMGSLKK
jgi:hypothetical protein